MSLKPYELKLIAKLLELASDKFANHGCNDYNLVKEAGLTLEEAIAINQGCADFYGLLGYLNHDEVHSSDAVGGDSGTMSYLASRLKDESEKD